MAERIMIRAGHVRFKLVKRDIEVVGNMQRGNELALVLETGGRGRQSLAGRKQRLQASREAGVVTEAIHEICAARRRRSRMRSVATAEVVRFMTGAAVNPTSVLGPHSSSQSRTDCQRRGPD